MHHVNEGSSGGKRSGLVKSSMATSSLRGQKDGDPAYQEIRTLIIVTLTTFIVVIGILIVN